ncbi:unnamed protein product [Schistocephalus solidus]|nr:unnamed protein product [Schistocephalus solidus]
MSVPVRLDKGGSATHQREKVSTAIPISVSVGDRPVYKSRAHFDSSFRRDPIADYPAYFDRAGDDIFGRLEDPLPLRRSGDSEQWFEDMRRRFDERRRQWDEEMRKMREEFFMPLGGPRGLRSDLSEELSATPATEHPVSTHYDRGEDGRLRFVARFDVRDFNQEDLQVTLKNGQIVLFARKELHAPNSTSRKEFTRTVDLPKGVEDSQISASLSADNILIVECPLRTLAMGPPTQNSASSGSGTPTSTLASGRFSSRNLTASPSSNLSTSLRLSPPNFHVEIPIGSDYEPGEIQVRTLNNRVYICAKHEERVSNRNTFRNFSKEYDIPDYIDPRSVTARLEQGVLYLEGTPFT